MSETFSVDLRRPRTANGGWEWYFVLGSTPIYPTEHRCGVFTGPGVTPAEAFPRVLRAWGLRP
jgi:hypothetical protein